MAYRLGAKGKLYCRSGGRRGGGGWIELKNARDVSFDISSEDTDVSTRETGLWGAAMITRREITLDFELLWKRPDTGINIIRNAAMSDAIIGFRILDEEGGSGLEADFVITSMSRSEPLREPMTVSVSAKSAYSEDPPSWS